ncbi:MAG: PIN domain-containing protein [Anaerolineae bacterium]|nr:PIN domain-containing protein [Anaerolineae bacterium]
MTGDRAFLDTNILLRATIRRFPQHEQVKRLVSEQIDAGVELWISRQVIREYLQQATRPQVFMNPMTIEQVEPQVIAMHRLFRIADETEAVTTQLLALLKSYSTGGKQVHDANIVATMLVSEIDTLLTLNLADFRRFADKIKLVSLEEENP